MIVNNISAFTPRIVKASQTENRAYEFDQLLTETNADAKRSAQSIQNQQPYSQDAVLNESERAYFEELFPQTAKDLRSHPLYQRDGIRANVQAGSMLDRKG
jgi:hypothetical protein